MQQKMLHEKFQGIRRIDATKYSPIVYERKEKLEHVKKLRSEGCSEATALEVVKLSRAVYYRLKKRYAEEGLGGLERESKRPYRVREKKWGRIIEQCIYHLRCKFPFWGKSTITVRYNKAAETQSIPLWVLPPRSPKLNGVVERGNGTVKYEFYAQYDKHASGTTSGEIFKN